MPSIITSASQQQKQTQRATASVKIESNQPVSTLTFVLFLFASLLLANVLVNNAGAQTPPPSLGQETKGTPSVDEEVPLPADETTEGLATNGDAEDNNDNDIESLLGTATIKESRRENGQLYEIELDHSLGGKQYIQENDSDGKIESSSSDVEETPNLPKWKLGSWWTKQ